jgi:death-on-curing protein
VGEIIALTLADVVGLHAFIMRRTGAQPSTLRDQGLLDSALARPRMAAHYEGADLIRQSSILAVAISQAQAFVDGNKRTAFITAVTFLRVNGVRFQGDPLELAKWLERIASVTSEPRDAMVMELAAWLRTHVARDCK